MFSSLGLSGIQGCGLGGGRLFASTLVPKDLSCRDAGFDDGGSAPMTPNTAEPDSRSDIWKGGHLCLETLSQDRGRTGTEGGLKNSAKAKEDGGAEHQSVYCSQNNETFGLSAGAVR